MLVEDSIIGDEFSFDGEHPIAGWCADEGIDRAFEHHKRRLATLVGVKQADQDIDIVLNIDRD